MKVRALNPVAERRRSPSTPIAARLPRLEGAVLGVIDNRRPNADIFLARLVELLQSRYQFREIVLRRKPSVTEAAPFLDEMAERCDAVVNAMVDHGACMAWSPADSANLERLGTPTATICSADVIDLCRDELRALGLESLSVIGAEPTAEIVPEAVPRCADAVLDSVVRVLTTPAEDLSRQALSELPPEVDAGESLEIEDSLEGVWQWNALLLERGWGDGLPAAPPTAERVGWLLSGVDRPPDEIVGVVPPRRGIATVEKLAVNAAMAGCRPEQLPVLLAALEAMLDEDFNLAGIQTTTNPCGPLLIVNGPLAGQVGLNAGFGALGPGSQANACLGRAVRLCLLNIGGGRVGREDRATQGQPGKYSFCFAENEAESPWEPLHVERGFRPEDSTVTVVGAEGPQNINDHAHQDAHGILTVAAKAMGSAAGNHFAFTRGQPLLVLAPYHARRVAAGGLDKVDVKRFLHEQARAPLAQVKLGGMWGLGAWPAWYPTSDDAASVPLTEDWQDMMVAVAGGSGKHSCWVPTFGMTRAVTRRVSM